MNTQGKALTGIERRRAIQAPGYMANYLAEGLKAADELSARLAPKPVDKVGALADSLVKAMRVEMLDTSDCAPVECEAATLWLDSQVELLLENCSERLVEGRFHRLDA